jgi:hypothetical protein
MDPANRFAGPLESSFDLDTPATEKQPARMRHVTFPRGVLFALAALVVGVSPASWAAIVTYNITATGFEEVTSTGTPNQGDPDGTAFGTLTLNNGNGTGTTGSATFDLRLSNLDLTTLSGHHVHVGAATTTGAIVLNFGDPDTIRTGDVLSGIISGLSATQITSIFANPSNFYYNLHNGAFPGGAVRDQLVVIPEPASACLLIAGTFAVALRRRTVCKSKL